MPTSNAMPRDPLMYMAAVQSRMVVHQHHVPDALAGHIERTFTHVKTVIKVATVQAGQF